MKESLIRVQQHISSGCSDEELLFIKQMGIKYVFVSFRDEDTSYDAASIFMERLNKFDLIATDGGNYPIYKNASIHLGLPDRDEHIKRYNDFTRVLGKIGIRIGYMTWEPNQVLTTRFGVGAHTRGAVGRIVDINQLMTESYSHGKQFTEDEMWDNFKYFLDRALPVCEEANVRIALHPCDPPVPSLRGIYNLIHSAADYKRAFELSGNSPYLGMKLCTGCWLEGGDQFGNLLEDIKYFVEQKKVFIVHFRNVDSPIPYFEETLLEDGYMDMYKVIKQLIASKYDGTITVDHVPEFVQEFGGKNSSYAYSLGYMKGLINSALSEMK